MGAGRADVESGGTPAGASRFVGRADELRRIRAAAEAALSGQARLVWVEGSAGAGKTALVEQALRELPPDFRVIRAEADEFSREHPLWIARQLAPIDAPDALGAGLQLLGAIADLQQDSPVALIVEDLHWADSLSREAILVAARRLGRDAVLTVVTSRPESAALDGWERMRLDPRRCEVIDVGPLAVPDVIALAADEVTLSTPAAERLYRHTGGHALYLRTLLAELRPEQLLALESELPAPRSLAAMTAARLAELPGEARALALALAVIARPVRLATAARVAAVASPTAALDALLSTGFFTWRNGDAGALVGFAHPLLRTAVYGDLSPLQRQRLHLAAAEELGPVAGLPHRVAAVDGTDDALADELVALARAGGAADVAAEPARLLLWASAVRTPGALADRHLTDAVRRLLDDSDLARATRLRPEVEASTPGPARSLVLGILDWEAGDGATAVAELRSAAASDDPEFIAETREANVTLARILGLQGHGPEAIAAASRALEAPELLPPRLEHMAWLGSSLGVLMRDGGPASLAQLSRRLPQAANDVGPQEVDLLVVRGVMNYFAGRPAASATDLRAAIALIHGGAAAAELHRAHYQLAQSLLLVGSWDEAMMHARTALEIVQDQRLASLRVQAHCVLASLSGLRGQWVEAEEQLGLAASAASVGYVLEALMTLMIARATVAHARGEWAEVINAFAPLLGGSDRSFDIRMPMSTTLNWWPMIVSAWMELGDFDEAARQLELFERFARERGLAVVETVLGLRARLVSGRSGATMAEAEQAIALLREAIANESAETPVLVRVDLHRRLGRLLVARGARRDGVEELRAAHRLLDELGAAPDLARVATELEQAGADPGVPSVSPLSALTERETDVAALVVRGMTNREVAAELYVTEKAIEYHLGNVYAKLGLRSRRELRALARAS